MDEIDRKLLALLQEDGRMPNREIARRLGMAASSTHERIKRLEERGPILGYQARLDPDAAGLGLLAFVMVKCRGLAAASDTADALARIPNVLEVHHVAGDDCFLTKIRCENPKDLKRVLSEEFARIEAIEGTRTTIALETIKESGVLPLERDPS